MQGINLPGELGGVGDRVQEAASVLGKSEESAARASYAREFGTGNFDTFGGDVSADKFIQVAEFEVPASTEYSWGYGSADNPENQGYLYIDLKDGSSNPVDGTVQFAQETPTGRGKRVVAEFDTTRLDASKTDKAQMVPFPEQVSHPLVTQDSSLTVYFTGANDTVNSSNSEVIIPVTEYDLGTGGTA